MLITFLRIALGAEKTLPHPLTSKEWEKLLQDAADQSVIGLVNSAIASLSEEMQPPYQVRMAFAIMTDDIRERNARIDGAILKIMKELKEVGLEGCILKGQGLARLYPDPALRQGGDIDVWVKGSREEIFSAIHKKWKTPDIQIIETTLVPPTDGISVEIHFLPTYMFNPFADRRIVKWCRAKRETFISDDGGSEVIYPDIEFHLVFCAIHTLRHIFLSGIGLRQIIDYFFLLRHSSAEERERAYIVLRRIGLKRFAGALMYVLQENFKLEDEFLLCSPSPKTGEFLRKEILKTGNFGEVIRSSGTPPRHSLIPNSFIPYILILSRTKFFSKLFFFLLHIRRMTVLYPIAPSEIIWLPAFNLRICLWNKFVSKKLK